MAFDKHNFCGTRHLIETGKFGEVEYETCPWIPSDAIFFFYTGIKDPDEETAISASFRGPTRQD